MLQISAAGLNENVVIEDRLTGAALIFNRDVTIASSVSGTVSAVPDYASVENGFRVVIPRIADKEVLTLRYLYKALGRRQRAGDRLGAVCSGWHSGP